MEFIIIAVALLLLAILLDIKFRNIKKISNDAELNNLIDKLQSNKNICEDILKIVGRDIEIEEDENSDKSLYIVLTDKIIIGKMKLNYVRVQTIAHECVHCAQNRKILLSNFFLTNIFNVYFIVSVILTIIGVFKNIQLQLLILVMIGIVCACIRNYLETNAMTKAEFIAEKYLQTTDLSEVEITQLMNKYKEINNVGIPLSNYVYTLKSMAKPLIYSVIAIFI